MEVTERLVRTWMGSGREDEVTQIVSDICSGQTTLLNLVRALGEFLTNEEDLLRTKGVELLSRVLNRCPLEKINRQATRVLVTFYCGKLEDTETVIPALSGCVPLSALPTFTSTDAVEMMTALYTHVNVKDHVQSTRYLIYSLIDSLMARHRDALFGMGDDFVSGYIKLADGEKDPRNLMLAFSIDRVICIEFDISKHVEEMFNIIFCYFPITFKQPANDPYGITADDLRERLRTCLIASPLFGPHAIPLFLEKLLSGSPSTKLDILDTMTLCLPAYGPHSARNFSKKLWNSLKTEVFQPINVETEQAALRATQSLIQTIYNVQSSTSDSVEGLAKEICTECLENLAEPEKSHAIPASKVMAQLIGTTPVIARYSLSRVIPHLVKFFQNPDEIHCRPQILTLLAVMVSAVSAAPEDQSRGEYLAAYKDDVLGAFMYGVKVASCQEAALDGLKKMSQIIHLLTPEELSYVVHGINEVLLDDSETALGGTGDDALDVLISISERNSKIVVESTLPLLFSSLPDTAPARDAHVQRAKIFRTLRWLSRLCIPAPLFETFVVRLSTKLDLICAPQNGSQSTDLELASAYAHAILVTLSKTFETKAVSKHPDVTKYIERFIPWLFNLLLYLALSINGHRAVNVDSRILKVSGEIITCVLQAITPERQLKFARDLENAFFGDDLRALAKGSQELPLGVPFKPFAKDTSPEQKDFIALLAAAVVSFHKGVFVPGRDPVNSLQGYQTWCLDTAENELQRNAAHHMCASLLNKNPEVLSAFVSYQLDSFWTKEVNNRTNPASRRCTAIQSWLWIGRALLIRNNDSTLQLVDKFFELLDDREVGWDAARTIGKLADAGDEVLTKRNHSVIRVLYAQKYFKAILPRILASLHGPTQTPFQMANLVALTSLITSLPKSTYVQELPTLMPLLIRSLDIPDVDIRTGILKTLISAADSGGEGPTSEHASTLVTVTLKSALPQSVTSAALRLAALQYLTILPRVVRYDILHPHKASVLRQLSKALDDPKRTVRREAVEARTAWFMYKG